MLERKDYLTHEPVVQASRGWANTTKPSKGVLRALVDLDIEEAMGPR